MHLEIIVHYFQKATIPVNGPIFFQNHTRRWRISLVKTRSMICFIATWYEFHQFCSSCVLEVCLHWSWVHLFCQVFPQSFVLSINGLLVNCFQLLLKVSSSLDITEKLLLLHKYAPSGSELENSVKTIHTLICNVTIFQLVEFFFKLTICNEYFCWLESKKGQCGLHCNRVEWLKFPLSHLWKSRNKFCNNLNPKRHFSRLMEIIFSVATLCT